jgi:dihydrodipicolinate synthase/N-acetylneuraminate lyase
MRAPWHELLMEGTVIPATPLALTAGKKLDKKRQRLLIRYYLHAGAGGIATGVHSTQFEIHDPKVGLLAPVLSVVSEEIDRFADETGKPVIKIAGACGPTAQAVEEAGLARDLGYHAVLLSPGGLSGYTEEDFLARAKAVAEVMPVIGFALQTAVGGPVFSYDFWEKLCEIKNVIAIKAAPFNRYQTMDIVRAAAFSSRSKEIALYTGNDDNIVIDLLTDYSFSKDEQVYTKGFAGGLLGHYSCWTKTAVDMFKQIKDIKKSGVIPAELLTIAAKVTDMNAAIFDPSHGFAGCISGMHEVLRRQGLLEGIWCLNDKERLSPGQEKEIDRVCAMYPELTDDGFIRENLVNWGMDLK